MRSEILDACEACFDKTVQYYDISSECCTVTVVLDPRLKLDFYFEKDSLDRCAEENEKQKNEVYEQVKKQYESEYAPVVGIDKCSNDDSDREEREEEGESSDSSGIFDFVPSSERGTTKKVDEFRSYLLDPQRYDRKDDPIQWWQNTPTYCPPYPIWLETIWPSMVLLSHPKANFQELAIFAQIQKIGLPPKKSADACLLNRGITMTLYRLFF
jgi:hypothetical protein